MSRLKPALVLGLVMIVITALLMGAHNLTYKDTSGIMTEQLELAATSIFGEGEYSIITDIAEVGFTGEKPDYLLNIIINENKDILLEIRVSGYNKDSIQLLIGVDETGAVGIETIQNTETPSIGTNATKPEFLEKLLGKNQLKIVKGKSKGSGQIETVSGATYSARGVVSAVNHAIEIYSQLDLKGGE